MNAEFAAGELVKTGRGKATAFSGFCDGNDKVFLPIDTQDYLPDSEEHNYLFNASGRKRVQHRRGSKPYDYRHARKS